MKENRATIPVTLEARVQVCVPGHPPRDPTPEEWAMVRGEDEPVYTISEAAEQVRVLEEELEKCADLCGDGILSGSPPVTILVRELRRSYDETRADLAQVKEGRRRAAQMLIEEIGAPGPESIEETAKRAVDAVRTLKQERDEARAVLTETNARVPKAMCLLGPTGKDFDGLVARAESVVAALGEVRRAFEACDEQREANQDDAEVAEKRLAEVEVERDQAKASLADIDRLLCNVAGSDVITKAEEASRRIRVLSRAKDAARAEVEQWRTKYNETRTKAACKVKSLKHEIERLRKELEATQAADSAESTKPCGCTGGPVEHVMDCATETPDGSDQPESVTDSVADSAEPTNVPNRCDTCKHEEKSSNESPCDICGRVDGGAWCPSATGYPLWEPQQAHPPTEAPERVWCEPYYDAVKDVWCWDFESTGWAPTKNANHAVEYTRTDVAEREREEAVQSAYVSLAFRLGYHPGCDKILIEDDIYKHVRECEEHAVKGTLEAAAERAADKIVHLHWQAMTPSEKAASMRAAVLGEEEKS